MAKKSDPSKVTVAMNRRARHDYFINETVEAGLVLQGTEVKSLRSGRASIAESYASEHGGEIFNRHRIGHRDVFADQVRAPRADRTLEGDHTADGHGVDVFCWLGRVGEL